MKPKTNEKKRRLKNKKRSIPFRQLFIFKYLLSVKYLLPVKPLAFICVNLWLIFLLSCSSKPIDLRNFVPAETLVYLESNDLAKTLNALTANKAFESLAKNKPDFSALENMQLAVAVTGFEVSQQQAAAENIVPNFKPRFVAVAETHAWNWQTLKFTENKLGEFVNDVYGGEVNLETSDKSGGKWFVWTATDNRKAFAFVQSSRIFFGNDESSIEKCLAVQRGETDNFAQNGKRSEKAKEALAFGYVSGEGIAQIANILGVSTAIEATDDEEGRDFIAGILPALARNSVKEIFWTAGKTDNGAIEDRYSITLAPEVSAVIKETLVATGGNQIQSAEYIPSDVFGVTRYNLKNPQIAWRSLLLVAANQTDPMSGKILTAFSANAFEAYGVTDAETFLSAVDSEILTMHFDAEGEKTAAIVGVEDAENIKKSVGEINFKTPGEKQGNAEIWKSENAGVAAVLVENKLILGEAQSVLSCLESKSSGRNFTKNALYKNFSQSDAVAVTFAKDDDSATKIVGFLAETKAENQRLTTNLLIETRFGEKGIERVTVSPFGLIGTILEQIENR